METKKIEIIMNELSKTYELANKWMTEAEEHWGEAFAEVRKYEDMPDSEYYADPHNEELYDIASEENNFFAKDYREAEATLNDLNDKINDLYRVMDYIKRAFE